MSVLLGKQYKSEPVFYGWISVIPSLKYSQIREDLLCFVPWYTENLPRKKSPTQKSKIFIGFSVVESAGRLTPFKLETPESLEKNGFWASSDLYCFPKGIGKMRRMNKLSQSKAFALFWVPEDVQRYVERRSLFIAKNSVSGGTSYES